MTVKPISSDDDLLDQVEQMRLYELKMQSVGSPVPGAAPAATQQVDAVVVKPEETKVGATTSTSGATSYQTINGTIDDKKAEWVKFQKGEHTRKSHHRPKAVEATTQVDPNNQPVVETSIIQQSDKPTKIPS